MSACSDTGADNENDKQCDYEIFVSKPLLSLFALVGLLASSAFAMVEMKDEQLSQVTGQALLQMGKTEGRFTLM